MCKAKFTFFIAASVFFEKPMCFMKIIHISLNFSTHLALYLTFKIF